MQLDKTIDFHLKATWHSIVGMYNKLATEHGISQTIGYVLLNINKEGIPATQIAPLLGMQSTSLSRLLKNMEDAGLIFRKPDEDDKRIVLIFLTQKGITKRRTAKKTIFAFNEKIKQKIAPEKLNTFYSVMKTLNKLAIEETDKMNKD